MSSAATRSTLDVAGYPTAPTNLELEQVHVYVRHGTHEFYLQQYEPVSDLQASQANAHLRGAHEQPARIHCRTLATVQDSVALPRDRCAF